MGYNEDLEDQLKSIRLKREIADERVRLNDAQMKGAIEPEVYFPGPVKKETPQERIRREITAKVKADMKAEDKAKNKPSTELPTESEELKLLKALVKETTAGVYDGPILRQVDERTQKDPDFKKSFINLRKSMYPNGVPGK